MVRLAVSAIAALLIVWAGSIFWALIGEGDAPADAGFGAVPGPSQVKEISLGCGSGGCWREMVVDVEPPQAAQSLAAEMGIPQEQCEPLDLWTLRKTASFLSVTGN